MDLKSIEPIISSMYSASDLSTEELRRIVKSQILSVIETEMVAQGFSGYTMLNVGDGFFNSATWIMIGSVNRCFCLNIKK